MRIQPQLLNFHRRSPRQHHSYGWCPIDRWLQSDRKRVHEQVSRLGHESNSRGYGSDRYISVIPSANREGHSSHSNSNHSLIRQLHTADRKRCKKIFMLAEQRGLDHQLSKGELAEMIISNNFTPMVQGLQDHLEKADVSVGPRRRYRRWKMR